MTTIPRFNHISIIAVVAVASLVTAACGGDEDSAVIDTPSTTTVVESAPPVQEEQPCDTPQAEIQDDGYCYVDGQWYADAGAGNWVESDEPPATTTVELQVEQPVVEESPSETVDVVDESLEGHEEVEGYEEVEPEVICGEGLTLMEEFVTDTDNGCRAEICDDGRDHHGDCALPPADEPMTEEEVAELPTETIPYEEYGLEDCTEVSLGVCDQGGVLYCHDTVEGWTECPGQPSGDPCEHDESNPLSFAGSGQITGQIPTVTLSPDTWSVSVCLWDNTISTGQPERFLVNLLETEEEGRDRRIWIPLITSEPPSWDSPFTEVVSEVSAGEWSFAGVISAALFADFGIDQLIFEVAVTPEGGGSWVVTFIPNG